MFRAGTAARLARSLPGASSMQSTAMKCLLSAATAPVSAAFLRKSPPAASMLAAFGKPVRQFSAFPVPPAVPSAASTAPDANTAAATKRTAEAKEVADLLSNYDAERQEKIKQFMLETSANKLTRARANKKDKMHRFSRWVLFFETWTVIFWLGLGGYIVHRIITADDDSFIDTINTAWRNATEFSFDRSRLHSAEEAAALEAAAAEEEAANSIMVVLEEGDAESVVPVQSKKQRA